MHPYRIAEVPVPQNPSLPPSCQCRWSEDQLWALNAIGGPICTAECIRWRKLYQEYKDYKRKKLV